MRPKRSPHGLGVCALVLLALEGVAAGAHSPDEVCRRWVCDRAEMSEGVSTGNVTSCEPGDLSPPGRPNALKLVNLGSGGRTMTASCFYQVGGTGKAGVAYVAWPPAGPVPLQAFTATELDKSGWSLQSDTINLNAATATVMDGTTSKPVTVSTNLGSYGAKYAMGITPNGWTSQAGHSYAVTIGGTTTPISYTVEVVDCSSTATSCTASDGGVSTTGQDGSSGTGGASATGTGGSSNMTGMGGAGTNTTGTGGSSTTTGTGGDKTTTPASGCSCTTSEPSRGPLAFVVLLLLVLILRRRKIL